jgi:alpha-tubulin suppressor-like RCC1 family protein
VCEALSALRPIQLAGGEQTLFAITSDGRVYATGWSPATIFNIKLIFYSISNRQDTELAVG